MNVSTTQPFKIIFSLYEHEYLGYLFETYAVQLDHNDKLTLKHQHINNKIINDFAFKMDETDLNLVKLIDNLDQETIVKKFSTKKVKPDEFLQKVFNKEKGDEILQGVINNYLENVKADILELLHNKPVFEMGSDGEPTWRQVTVEEEKASVLFHFRRNEENTHYFPTIRHKGQKLDFQYKNAIIINNKPAWMLKNFVLYSFERNVDGQKLKPFLTKWFIEIPRKIEDSYYEKFITPLISSFDVLATGFQINEIKTIPKALLKFTLLEPAHVLDLFNSSAKETPTDDDIRFLFQLTFQYDSYLIDAFNFQPFKVQLEKTENSYIFHKIKRNLIWEKSIIDNLRKIGIDIKNGKTSIEKIQSFEILRNNTKLFEDNNIYVSQLESDEKKYFYGESSINFEITENIDWFEINAIIWFGNYQIPFLELRKHISKRKKEFTLPDGSIAIIPAHWFSQYADLFKFSIENKNGVKLKKHHLSLINDLQDNLIGVTFKSKLSKLANFTEIEEYELPKSFKGELRPYQKAGYNWMRFLNEYKLGGCLADDMGLGKTIQTLSLLLYDAEKENITTSLLVVPTSLIYNWLSEASKFTPDLKIICYTGTNREKNILQFENYHLVLTTYGTVRQDSNLLSKFYFNYIILDESQAIKNPASLITQEIEKLSCKNRLILSGTPIENSTMDLWSQMNFVNPGLLGSFSFFRNEFLVPIEKQQDEDRTKKLYSLIKPFILRRKKSDVVKELPDKIEQIRYCEMTEEQSNLYEETKSYYRNALIENKEKAGSTISQVVLIQGLLKLRQIANHPFLFDRNYTHSSGKFLEIIEMIETALAENHKILIFSSFVKHLVLFKQYLEEHTIPFNYIDGSVTSKNRQSQVDAFQTEESVRVFLISLKAGGTGLNLTAADYVFILDPWWNPASEAQAVDRAHRIGQKNTVFNYKFITKGTIEEKILHLQQSKLKLANDLIDTDEGFIKSLSREDIENLLL